MAHHKNRAGVASRCKSGEDDGTDEAVTTKNGKNRSWYGNVRERGHQERMEEHCSERR